MNLEFTKRLAARDELSRSLLLTRFATGAVFVVSGIVKFLYENQGAGRFAKLGFSPAVATFVGTVGSSLVFVSRSDWSLGLPRFRWRST